MKKFVAIALLLTIAPGFVACDSNGTPQTNKDGSVSLIGLWEATDGDGTTWFYVLREDGTGFFDSNPSSGSVRFTHKKSLVSGYHDIYMNNSIATYASIEDGKLVFGGLQSVNSPLPFEVKDSDGKRLTSFSYKGNSDFPVENPVTISQWIVGTWIEGKRDNLSKYAFHYIFNSNGTGIIMKINEGTPYDFTWAVDSEEFLDAKMTITVFNSDDHLSFFEDGVKDIRVGPKGEEMRWGFYYFYKEN